MGEIPVSSEENPLRPSDTKINGIAVVGGGGRNSNLSNAKLLELAGAASDQVFQFDQRKPTPLKINDRDNSGLGGPGSNYQMPLQSQDSLVDMAAVHAQIQALHQPESAIELKRVASNYSPSVNQASKI